MLFPVLQCQLFGRVGIAVFAKMWAGIIFTNILRAHALTERTLPLVFLVLTDEIMVMRQEDCSFWQLRFTKQCRSWYIFNLYLHEFHQILVIPSKAGDKVTIDAAIVLNAIFRDVYSTQRLNRKLDY